MLTALSQVGLIDGSNLKGYWVVTGVGGVRLAPVSTTASFEIEVEYQELHTPTIFSYEGSRLIRAPLTGKSVILLRPMNTVLRYCYGDVLNNGKYVGRRFSENSPPQYNCEMVFDTENDHVQLIERSQKDENGQYIINTRRIRNTPQKDKGLFLYIKTKKIEVVIPCLEIFKTYYLYSRGLTQSLLSEHVLAPEKYIYDGTKSTFIKKQRLAFVQLRSHLRNSDAGPVSRFFLGEQSATARAGLQKAFKLWITANHSELANLAAFLPFKGEEKWKYDCIPLPGSVRRHFITKIHECSSDWGVDSLIFRRDNPGAKVSGSEEEGESRGSKYNEGSTNRPPTLINGDLGDKPLKNDQLPETDDNSPDVNQQTIDIFPDSLCQHWMHPPSIEDNYPSKKSKGTNGTYGPNNDEELKHGSSADGKNKDKNTGKLEPKNNAVDGTEAFVPQFVSYHATLYMMQYLSEGRILVKYIAVSKPIVIDRESVATNKWKGRLPFHRRFNTLPVPKSEPFWCFSDRAKMNALLVQIMEIKITNQYVYYIEFQPRLNKQKSFILAYKDLFEEFSVNDHFEVLNGFANHRISKKLVSALSDKIKIVIKKHTALNLNERVLRWYDMFEDISLNLSVMKRADFKF